MKPMTLFLVGASLLATPAIANDDIAVMKKYGLMGKNWAIDCSKPVSEKNPYSFYGVGSNGTLMETLRSTDGDKARELRNVQVISPEWILYTMIDTDKEPINILTKIEGKRMRSWWSVGKDGTAYLINGELNGDGGAPWFEQCN